MENKKITELTGREMERAIQWLYEATLQEIENKKKKTVTENRQGETE